MGLSESVAAAVDGLYAAAAGQGTWHAALDGVLDAMSFTHASVYAFDRSTKAAATADYRLPVTGLWHRHDPVSQAEYEAEYFKLEPGRHFFLAHPDVRIRHDHMFISEREMDRHPYYDWALRGAGLRHIVVGQTDPAQPLGAALSLQRGPRAGAITQAEIERLTLLLGHFQRAIEVEHKMGHALAVGIPTQDALDRNPAGIVILDALGRVVLANASARRMAARADALLLSGRAFGAIRLSDNDILQKHIGRAIAGGMSAIPDAMRLPRRNGLRDYSLIVTPLSRRESVLSSLMPAACILISDPDAEAPASAGALRRLYGLSANEAAICERLIAGDSPAQIAAALGITIATARTHIASIFRKTDTHRQGDLIRVLVAQPLWLLE